MSDLYKAANPPPSWWSIGATFAIILGLLVGSGWAALMTVSDLLRLRQIRKTIPQRLEEA